MNEDGRTFIRAVVQKSHDAGIVQILLSHMIADLHA